jgi:hypothetical protein
MLIAILNHGHTAAALALKRAFAAHAPTVALDSGSTLTAAERAGFDVALPNVYYSGLLNAVAELAAPLGDGEPVYCWASDVSHSDPAQVLARAQEAFADPAVGTYAPSAWYSGHPQMWQKRTGRLRRVLFVEGFCFATRAGLLRQLCPIDTTMNSHGWGIDIHLGYLTRGAGLASVVDDRLRVEHPRSTGYSATTAARQRKAWAARLPRGARWFHRLASIDLFKRGPGMRVVLALPWSKPPQRS